MAHRDHARSRRLLLAALALGLIVITVASCKVERVTPEPQATHTPIVLATDTVPPPPTGPIRIMTATPETPQTPLPPPTEGPYPGPQPTATSGPYPSG